MVDQQTAYILTRGSGPEAVIIPYDQYRRFVAGGEGEVLARIEQLLGRMTQANVRYSDDEIEADLHEATREVRERKAVRRGA